MAMDRLEQEGAVRRVQGRGTFVAATKLEYPLGYEPEGDVHRPGEDLPYHVLGVETPPAGEELGSLFGIDPAEPVVRVRRVAVHEHTVTALDTLAVPLSINPSLPSADFRRGRLFFILADHGIKIVRNRLTIQSVIVDPSVAALLRVRPGVPAIQITRVGLDPTRQPVAHVDIVARGDIARYVIEAPVETGSAASFEGLRHV
jgi:GntR family transcriptional regulator